MKKILLCLLASASMAVAQIQYNHGDPTDYEQLMLELVNRARANPNAEASRLGINLNEGVTSPLITTTPKPPLAFHRFLIDAARNHSQWMLNTNSFSHTGQGGTTAKQRMEAAGYTFTGSWRSGENIGWQGTTGFLDQELATYENYKQLFLSPSHRKNICIDDFDEVGIGIRFGPFFSSPNTFNAIMATQKFTKSDSTPQPMVVGAVYYDFDGDGLYSVGEGIGGVSVTVAGGTYTTNTASSGGYTLPAPSLSGTRTITFSGPGLNNSSSIEIPSATNVKKDIVLAYEAPEITGTTEPVVGASTPYSISPVPGATALHVTVAAKSPALPDNAEDLNRVVDETSGAYSPLATSLVHEGSGAYFLTRNNTASLEILRYQNSFVPGPNAVMQFRSRMGWALSGQVARVEVSADGGLTWTSVYQQAGSGAQESSFFLRSASLSAFAGQRIQIRFNYLYTGGSWYSGTSTAFGWIIDAITFSDINEVSDIQSQSLAPGEQFDFIPPAEESYLLQIQPEHDGKFWPLGTVLEVSAKAPDVGYLAWASSWESLHGLAPGALSEHPTTDHMGDGLSNLLKFAFGGTPITPAQTLSPSHGIDEILGQRHLTISHRRLEGSGSGTTESGYTVHGLTYLIQTSNSLLTDSWNSGPSFLQETSVDSNGDGTETVTVRLIAPISQRQFIRLQVTEGP